MVCLQALRPLLPATVRRLIRHNKIALRNTSGMSAGYNQANVVILHRSVADDFEKFCHANNGPLPLLYRSAAGECRCPPLSTDSDIRTDCLQYRRYEHGVFTGSLSSLEEYSEQLREMVTFYLGCSFTFESAVQKLGVPVRNVEQGRNVSMYKTAVPCHAMGKFSCNLVVTMRPIPQEKLNAAAMATHLMKNYHGAPVHIGYPDFLGIKDLQTPEYGDPVETQPGDVPVFWACGVTGVEAVLSCKSPLAFTHSPGCMFITDLKNEDLPESGSDQVPLVIEISSDPLHYSLVSQRTAKKIQELERIIGADPELLKEPVSLLSYKGDGPDSAVTFLCENGDPSSPRFDHLIAIERAGRAADGNYYNARKINIKPLVDPIDDLFVAAQNICGITTTGIGDGGNELGTGKVKDLVRKYIPNGDTIACDVPADFTVIAGVSNWGGYAVACALYLLNTCKIHERYLRRAVGFPRLSEQKSWVSSLPSVDKEEKLLEILVHHGIRSGKTGNLAMEVDGLPFHNTHSDMIRSLLDTTV